MYELFKEGTPIGYYIDIVHMILYEDPQGLIPVDTQVSMVAPMKDEAYRVRVAENSHLAEYYVRKADNHVYYRGAAVTHR